MKAKGFGERIFPQNFSFESFKQMSMIFSLKISSCFLQAVSWLLSPTNDLNDSNPLENEGVEKLLSI